MRKENEILVDVTGVSKKFSRSLKRSLWYGLKEVMNTVFSIKANKKELRKDEFWAVKEVSFQLRRGECIGLIGHNGAGKSTLLKMLNGLIRPDEGKITMYGKIGALIELGAGFNPILTGRENVYINGQLLGFTKQEVDQKLSSILEFAEIGDFIDSIVQNYSSGMKVRLGFAIAAQMEPDVLIIDEVLAVGDLGFVLKCFNSIDNIMPKTAVIFVSHNMQQVSRICSSILCMEKGRSIFQGSDVAKGIDLYYSEFGKSKNKNVQFNRNDEVELLEIKIGDENNAAPAVVPSLNHLGDLKINIKLKVRSEVVAPVLTVTIFDQAQRPVGLCINEKGLDEKNSYEKKDGYTFYKVKILIERVNLSKGLYSVSLTVAENFRKNPMLRLQSVCEFQVFSKYDIDPPIEFESKWS
ncbi:MAG: ABC transporter ATP-binding protein [Bacteroidia bacterium]